MTRLICRWNVLVDLMKQTNSAPNRVVNGPLEDGEYAIDILDGLPEGEFAVGRVYSEKSECLVAVRSEFATQGLHFFPARPETPCKDSFDPLDPGNGFAPYILPPHIVTSE